MSLRKFDKFIPKISTKWIGFILWEIKIPYPLSSIRGHLFTGSNLPETACIKWLVSFCIFKNRYCPDYSFISYRIQSWSLSNKKTETNYSIWALLYTIISEGKETCTHTHAHTQMRNKKRLEGNSHEVVGAERISITMDMAYMIFPPTIIRHSECPILIPALIYQHWPWPLKLDHSSLQWPLDPPPHNTLSMVHFIYKPHI